MDDPWMTPRSAREGQVRLRAVVRPGVSSVIMSFPDPDSPADYRTLFEAAPGLLVAVQPDDAFHIIAASNTYLRATMTERDQLVGRPLFQAFPAAEPDSPTAASIQALSEALKRVRRNRTPETLPEYRYDLRRPDAEGGGFEERHWQTTVWPIPLQAEAGELHYLLCRTEDVTIQIRSEHEMADVRSRLEATLGAAEIGTWIWDVDSNRVFADRNLAKFFNTSTADANGGPIERFIAAIHPEDRVRVDEAVQTAAASNARFETEYRIMQPDGSVRWVVARGWSEKSETGGQRFPGVVLDITERRRAEDALRENSERLRMAVESANLGTWDFNPVTGALQWSETTRAMFGLPGEAPITYEDFLQSLHPDERERADQAVKRVLQPGSDGIFDEDFRIVDRTDGSERWIASMGRAFFNDQGQPERLIGTALDITLRKRAEEVAMRRSEQLQRLAAASSRLNAAHDVASVLGVVTAEARHLIGARHATTTATPVGQPRHYSSPVSASSHVDNEPPSPDAALPTLAVPMIGHGGQTIGVLELLDKEIGHFTGDDDAMLSQLAQIAAGAIENARLYEELRANDKRKDEFLAMLAHELRNPLAAIRNAVALGSDGADASDVEWSMDVIKRQTHNLSRLIDDLLDVSRITQGMVQLRKEALDASAILNRAVNAVRGLIEERKHTLNLQVTPEVLPLEADPARLEQMLVNLLVNAAKYTENGGEISLQAARENGHVVFRVRDNGVGIPPEKLPQMFELFAQGNRSLARSEGGLGIGLTVVRSLAEMHGGTVHATSAGLNQGSEFVVRLPAPKTPLPVPEASVEAATPVEELVKTPVRVLVVDDNVDSARATAKILSRNGYDVQVAYDGPAAVEAALLHEPAFVFLDIGLPGMNGYEVATRLRQEERFKDVMMVAVSGYGEEGDRRRSREAGFDQHLVKPVDPDILLALLRE